MQEETKNNSVNIVEEQDDDDDAKWVTHYCSEHQILLVGEGDFSFSLSLAKAFGSAANIVASSLNSYGGKLMMNENKGYLKSHNGHVFKIQGLSFSHVDDVTKMYKNAKSNLDDLHKLGACLLHGVDATKMKLDSDLKMRRFDRVIFNFPHAGFHGKEDNTSLIKMHRALVLGFFKNAISMLRANGEIHVSHKTTAPFSNWNIEKLAAQCFLTLIECADFKIENYPGYNNKRGDGNRCDEPFPLGKCCTYKFIYNPKTKQQNHRKRKKMVVSRQQTNLPLQEWGNAVEQLPTSVHVNYYPQTRYFPKMEDTVPSISGLTNRHTSITGCHLSNMAEVHGRGAPYGGYSARGMSQGSSRPLQPMEPLHALQPWRPTSINARYSMTDHVRTMDTVPYARNEGYHQVYCRGRSNYLQERLGRKLNTVPLSLGARNEGYQVYGGRSNYLQEELGRTTVHSSSYSFNEGHTLRDTLLKWPASTNVGYSLRHHARPMDPVPLSLDARNEGHHHVYDGCSNYWPRELGRTAVQEGLYSFDGVRSDFERYIAQVPGRSVQSELHRMSILMPERGRVFVEC